MEGRPVGLRTSLVKKKRRGREIGPLSSIYVYRALWIGRSKSPSEHIPNPTSTAPKGPHGPLNALGSRLVLQGTTATPPHPQCLLSTGFTYLPALPVIAAMSVPQENKGLPDREKLHSQHCMEGHVGRLASTYKKKDDEVFNCCLEG